MSQFVHSVLTVDLCSFQTGEKGLDLSDLWRSRPSPSAGSKNDAVAPVSTFKRWRRGGGARNGGGRSSPSHAQNCGGGKEPPGEGDRSLLKFLALVSDGLPTGSQRHAVEPEGSFLCS
jgi:hypothetical protein